MFDVPRVLEVKPGLPEDFSIREAVEIVQFSRRLQDLDYRILAEALSQRPEVTLRIYDRIDLALGKDVAEFSDLDFLKYFPRLKRLQVDLWLLENTQGLEAVDDLTHFGFGRTKKRTFSLKMLQRFRNLEEVYLERQQKDIDVLATLPNLRLLTLRSINLPDLGIFANLPRLKRLEIKLGGTTDIKSLSLFKQITSLELWLVRGVSDLSVLAEMTNLESFMLQALRNVTSLPSLRKLERLRLVHLETMKGLTEICGVADAPALEELQLVVMRNLDPETLRCFAGHPTLREFGAGLCSDRRNAKAEAIVGIVPDLWAWSTPEQRAVEALANLKYRALRRLN